MTKIELIEAGLELINTSATDKKKTKADLASAFLELMNEYKGTKKSDKVSTQIAKLMTTDDGTEYVWCSRHQQYEPKDTFKFDKDGKPDAMCNVALKQWNAYSAQISKNEKMTMDLIDDVEALRAHVAATNAIKVLRASNEYDRSDVVGAYSAE